MSATIGQVLCWAQRRLTDAGLDEAKLEARWLVAHVLGVAPTILITRAQYAPPPGLTTALAPLLKRRAAREPLAHIIGTTEFFGLPFKTDTRALIPRSDSEIVVELALDVLPADATHIADLGTGTGCLAIALLAQRPGVSATVVDASADALALAGENAALNDVADRFASFEGSWTDWTGWVAADLVISNPPYIASDVIGTLAPEVRDHDPHMALDGGADGLAAYREIITLAAAQMQSGAWLVLEIGYDQREAVTDLLAAAGFADLRHRKDLGGNDRAIAAHLL